MKDISTAEPYASHYLSKAVWTGKITAVRQLLNKGLNVEEVANGRTPVLWAISGGHKNVMDLLIKKKADIYKKTSQGDTALICAVWGGNAEIVQMLVGKGFDPDEKGSGGKTALDWAQEKECPEVLAVLTEVVAPRRKIAAEFARIEAEKAQHAAAIAAQLRIKEQHRPKLKIASGTRFI